MCTALFEALIGHQNKTEKSPCLKRLTVGRGE